MKAEMHATFTLTVDDTELQMLYEAVRRVRPFAEMSAEMEAAATRLEHDLHALVVRLPE